MDWLGSNWIWLAIGAGAIAFFAFGRGGCGMGHGGHQDRQHPHQGDGARETAPLANQGTLSGEHAGHGSGPAQAAGQRHRHGCC